MPKIIILSRSTSDGLCSSYWNLLDYSSAIFPVGKLSPESIVNLSAYPRNQPRNETEKFISVQWDPNTYINAPISLQIVGRRLQEEKVLGILKVLEALV
jgi:amidase